MIVLANVGVVAVAFVDSIVDADSAADAAAFVAVATASAPLVAARASAAFDALATVAFAIANDGPLLPPRIADRSSLAKL